MHIQEGKPIKKASKTACGPKHCYNGGKHQPKHAQEAEKQPRGIGAYVVAVLFLILSFVLHDYAYVLIPLSIVSLVLSICALGRSKTGYSVTALVVSVLATVITASFTVLIIAEYFMGTSMASFMFFF